MRVLTVAPSRLGQDRSGAAPLALGHIRGVSPEMRHQYSLQKRHGRECPEFEAVVQFIYDHGTRRRFGNSSYRELIVGESFYWAMGWPAAQTDLINRKPELIDVRPKAEPRLKKAQKIEQLRLFE
jgi:hypothetical protein